MGRKTGTIGEVHKKSKKKRELPTHVYCEVCGDIEPAIFESLSGLNTSKKFRGGDIVCDSCKFVVATVFRKI